MRDDVSLARLSRRRLLTLTALGAAGLAVPARGQGFAGLGETVRGYAIPSPKTRLAFPADHAPHPDFRIEWWYVTANLAAADGTPYGVQWTLFRSALAPSGPTEGWATPQAWLAHAALTTPGAHHAAEKLARGGIGQAGVTIAPFDAWVDDWRLHGETVERLRMQASLPGHAFDLKLEAEGPLVLQGDQGYSVKSAAGQASHYYSQPFYRAEGTLDLPEGPVEVTGRAWLDREWSSQPLEENQSGWDWFSLHLDGGEKLMGFRLRSESGDDFTSATWIAADGTPTPYPDGAFRAEPLGTARVAGRDVPVRWRIALPDRGLDAEVAAINEAAWMPLSFAYWEGPVRLSGSHAGIGYLEMTGYE